MNRIQDSLHQILSCHKPRFGELFYDNFLAMCPSARLYFEHTNMQMQIHIVVNGLQMAVAMAGENYPAAKSYLKVLGHRHFERHIPADLYRPFCEAMLVTLRQFHADSWTPELEQDWRSALEAATAAMLEGYTAEPVFY